MRKTLAAVVVLLTIASTASAQTGTTGSSSFIPRPPSSAGYWTPERLLNAQPAMPRVQGAPGPAEAPRQSSQPASSGEGSPPTIEIPDNASPRMLIAPSDSQRKQQSALDENPDEVEPANSGTLGAVFTTTRVFPSVTVRTYPHSAVAKLFFHDPVAGRDFLCSAETLRPRIVSTAGHCCSHPSTNPNERYFMSNWLIVPAYDQGTAPLGMWQPASVRVSNQWFFSDGSLPNSQDVCIMSINDQTIFGAVHRIGEVTGWLGYLTNALGFNHIDMLGYPSNLDGGERQQKNSAQTFRVTNQIGFEYGSSMTGGSSGGPWVQDFGVEPNGEVINNLYGYNLLVGITSYDYMAPNSDVQGSSQLQPASISGGFEDMLITECNAMPGNC
jgi:V8-like Glu-specific endopeptidase